MSKLLTTFLGLTLLAGCSVNSPEPTKVPPVDPEALDPMEDNMGVTLNTTENVDGSYTFTVLSERKAVATFDKEKPVDGYSAYLFDEVGDKAYIAVDPTGLGGYILYSGAFELYEVNLSTGDVRQLAYEGQATDISEDGLDFVYTTVNEKGEQLVVLASTQPGGEFVQYKVPAEFDQAGDAEFSPDGSKLAYQATITGAEPNVEETAVFVIDLVTGVQTEFARQEGLFEILWQNDGSPIKN